MLTSEHIQVITCSDVKYLVEYVNCCLLLSALALVLTVRHNLGIFLTQ